MDIETMTELIVRVDERTSCIPKMGEDLSDLKETVAAMPDRDEITEMIQTRARAAVTEQAGICQEKRAETEKAKPKGLTINIKWPTPKYIVMIILFVLSSLGLVNKDAIVDTLADSPEESAPIDHK